MLLLAGCVVYLCARHGAVAGVGFVAYAFVVSSLSCVLAVWKLPVHDRATVRTVVLVNLIAHAAYYVALFGERVPPQAKHGNHPLLMGYPFIAIISIGIVAWIVSLTRDIPTLAPADTAGTRTRS